MLHAGSVASMSSSGHQHHYSTSPSSSAPSAPSVVVVKRSASPTPPHRVDPSTAAARHAAAQLAAEESSLAIKIPTSAFSRSPSPNPAPAEPQINDGVGNLNRWSQSTTSSVGVESPRRDRASSGAASHSIWNRRKQSASQPASPHREELSPKSVSKRPDAHAHSMTIHLPDQHRRNAPSLDKPLPPPIPPLTSLHIPMSSVVTPNEDTLLTANSFTPSSSGLLTPLSYSAFDYFGNGATASASSKRDPPPAVRHTHQTPSEGRSHSSSRHPSHHRQTSSIEEASSADPSQRRTKSRGDRRDKDKKTMLSKALEKANTAVLLDNAMNYEGALDAYQDACRLLEFVMDRTSGYDDKRKLDAIRDTYTIRIDELLQLQATTQSVREQKRLPPRPMSNGSLEFSPTLQIDEAMAGNRDSAVIETATLTRIIDAPSTRSFMPRNSFLTDAIREVEGSSEEGFLGPLWERSKSPFRQSTFSDRTARPQDDVEDTYIPRPLTPRRAPSAEPQEDLEQDFDDTIILMSEPASEPMVGSCDPVSWLDTIEESGSDASSVHSRSSRHSVHRKDLRMPTDDTEMDFDAAFDAAVEAAYEDGYMPDHDALGDASMSQSLDLDVAPPVEGFGFATDTEDELDEDAEEERILDDITRDYIDHGFDFDMQSKSALPRQSGSSGFSRDTWQSSVVSNRTTAGTSLSTVAKGVLPDVIRPESQSTPSGLDLAQSSTLLPDFVYGQSSARPLSVISEGSKSVQDRRSTGPNFRSLKIETTKQLDQRARAALPVINDELVKDDNEEDNEEHIASNRPISEVPSLHRFEKSLISPQKIHSAASDATIDSVVPPNSADTMSSMRSPRPRMFRKHKSSLSLRDHGISEEPAVGIPLTPLSASFGLPSAFHDNGLPTARRPLPHITASGNSYPANMRDGLVSTAKLFDTSLGEMSQPSSPQSQDSTFPVSLEPCPESTLLRPFWLLRSIASTISHSKGGYITNRLFVPREVWQTRNVKLRSIDDKVSQCDLLTAALGKLSKVDTYDADAVLEELQAFEEVMERVQAILIKRLGSDVGVQGVGAFFKDATTVDMGGAVSSEAGKDAPKTNSGKSYLWRKLRSKNTGAGGTGSFASATMPTVPMTSFVPVDKRTAYKHEVPQENTFEGPLKEYMYSLIRLCEAAQVLGKFILESHVNAVDPKLMCFLIFRPSG